MILDIIKGLLWHLCPLPRALSAVLFKTKAAGYVMCFFY